MARADLQLASSHRFGLHWLHHSFDIRSSPFRADRHQMRYLLRFGSVSVQNHIRRNVVEQMEPFQAAVIMAFPPQSRRSHV